MRGVAALVLVAACRATAPAVVLPPGARVLARGSLAYAVAFTADERVVSVELEERFALVVRSPDGRVLGRFDLGPPERDLPALAIAGDVAWVGGADREVRGVALADGARVASWPTGAAVTALAAVPGALAIGDGDGGLCLRRLPDGALLQCVQLADRAIDALAVATTGAGPRLIVDGGGARWALSTPALAMVAAPSTSAPAVRRAGRDVYIDGTRAARLAGVVRAIAVGPRGAIAIAAWIARLDDPSVVLMPARCSQPAGDVVRRGSPGECPRRP